MEITEKFAPQKMPKFLCPKFSMRVIPSSAGIRNISSLLKELTEVAPIWFTVGVFLDIKLYKIIRSHQGEQS